MKTLLYTSIILLISYIAPAQCSVVSSNGYIVNLSFTINSVVPSSYSCANGYNYNLAMSYTIGFSGSNIPSNLYTLQVTELCGNDNNSYYGLPLQTLPSSGNFTTTTNPWHSQSDCATITPTSMGCIQLLVRIHGPGIPDQVITCSPVIGLFINSDPVSGYYYQEQSQEQTFEYYDLYGKKVDIETAPVGTYIKLSSSKRSLIVKQ